MSEARFGARASNVGLYVGSNTRLDACRSKACSRVLRTQPDFQNEMGPRNR